MNEKTTKSPLQFKKPKKKIIGRSGKKKNAFPGQKGLPGKEGFHKKNLSRKKTSEIFWEKHSDKGGKGFQGEKGILVLCRNWGRNIWRGLDSARKRAENPGPGPSVPSERSFREGRDQDQKVTSEAQGKI